MKQKFLQLVHEVVEFCLRNANRHCFGGWSREKVFLRIAGAAWQGNLIVIRSDSGVQAVSIAKPTEKGLFIWEVIGSREACREMFRRALARWPGVKRFFAYRREKVVEINPETLTRFCLT